MFGDVMNLLKKIALSLMILSSLNALGQLSDNFSDGDFTNNPTWTGNTTSFLVNGLGQLQLTAPGPGQSTIATSFANTALGNKEWSFFIRQSFAGSDNNQSRLYLTANGTAMSYTGAGTAGVEGYFLKFGEGGSADAIRLFRDNGVDNPVEIAAATAGAISGSFSLRVKITRDNSGLWSILADYTGGNNLVFQTSVTDNTFITSNAFGWICNYTASNVANFFLDDVYFGDIIVDTSGPELVSATALSSTNVDVLFNEPLNETSAELTANYTIQGNVNPSAAVLDGTNSALVHLTFANAFPSNTDITLEVTDIDDVSGNTLTSAQTIFNFFIPASANYRDVVFNEILADPTPVVGLPEVEYVELHNHTSEAFNLANWSFVNSTTVKILPSYTLAPGGYVVLTDANNTAFFTNSIGITSFTALTNTTDSLTLLDNNGQLIDFVVYDIDWYETTEKANGGWSLELINPTLPCQSASNWSESNNALGGTPNAVNSVFNIAIDATAPIIISVDVIDNSTIAVQFSETMNSASLDVLNINLLPFINATTFTWNGTFDLLTFTTTFPLTVGTEYSLIISGVTDCSGNLLSETPVPIIIGLAPEVGQLRFTEIMADPEPSYGAPNAEYVELYNASDVVLDISDVTINSGVFTSSVILQPGEYITVANITNAGAFGGVSNKAFMLLFPGLSNTGGTITLSHPESGVLDEISYSIDWYNDATKDDGGYSLELINLTIPCTQSSNWTASNATIGGTPSAVNSVNSATPDTQNPILTYAAYFESSNTLQLFFSEPINNSTFIVDDFVITPSINLLEITQVSTNSVTITCLDNILLNTTYNISFSSISDCSGNVVSNGSFIIGRTPEAGDILITEIMAAPSNTVGQYRAEYIEIYNYSSDYIDMSSVTINNTPFETPFVLAPGEYSTIASLSNANLLTNISNIRFKASFPSLSNAGTELTLGTLSNTIIDFVAYTDQWYQDNSKDDGGWSLERINLDEPCSNQDNWRASLNAAGGTPSAINSVNDNTPDTAGPLLTQVLVPLGTVTLVFNEPVSTNSTIEMTINGESFTPTNVVFNLDQTAFSFNYNPVSGTIYNFTILSLLDCWENESTNISGVFAGEEVPQTGDIVINEVLSNPKDGGSDFIELYNNSPRVIGLSNWQIANENDGQIDDLENISEQGLFLLPGEYIVLTEDGSDLPLFYPFTRTNRIWRMTNLPTYNNDDGTVVLITPNGEYSDRFVYHVDLHFPLIDDLDGVSLEKIDPSRPSTDNTNWNSAAENQGFATPGYQNSQAMAAIMGDADIVIEPEIFSPDNDGYQDVLSIKYSNDTPGLAANIFIFDSNGRQVRHLTKNEYLGVNGSISWNGITDDGQLAPIGIYVIYFEVFGANGQTSKIKKTCVLAHDLN
jgi:hypothetical protein